MVLMSPSTLTALKLVATPSVSARLAARRSTAASVSTKTSSVAMSGAIMPAPFPMAATVITRPPTRSRRTAVFGKASVVMMARAASGNRAGPRAACAARTPCRSRGPGTGTPMRPVAQARTRAAGTPSSSAASPVDCSTMRSPSRPVQALALPAWTSTADAVPPRSRARVVTTGAAGTRLVVRTPAATPGRVEREERDVGAAGLEARPHAGEAEAGHAHAVSAPGQLHARGLTPARRDTS